MTAHGLAIAAFAAALTLAGPCAAADYYRLPKIEGAAPNRVAHIISNATSPGVENALRVSLIDVYETPLKDGASRVSTEGQLDCKARTWKPTIVQRTSDNGAQLKAPRQNAAAQPIKAGSPEDLYRALICDKQADGLKPVAFTYTMSAATVFRGIGE